jgi:hypothetical protein
VRSLGRHDRVEDIDDRRASQESGEYLADNSQIDFTDFAAADFSADGVIVELGDDLELHIALST